jgi:hypothetical protein
MKNKSRPRFWIIVDHPQQLVTAICVSRNCRKEYGVKGNLVVSRHAYWHGINIDEYKKEFNRIRSFERLDYPPPALSLFTQLAVSILLITKLVKMSIFVKNLNIGTQDIIIGLSTQQFLENKILSYYPKNKRIGVVSSHTYEYSRMKIHWKNYKYSLGSFLVRYLQYVFGMKAVVCKYRKRHGPFMDGDTIQRYEEPLSKIYDYLFVMRNPYEKVSNLNKLKSNIIFTRYPLSYNFGHVRKLPRKKIVYLGEDFFSSNNIDHKTNIVLVNRCLDFLRRNYNKNFDLIYKPHPRWNKELKVLNLKGYKVYKGHDPAELYFLKNRVNIYTTFSVTSTAARSAINAGLQSYLFSKLFPFKKSSLRDWGLLMGKIPKNSYIMSLKQRPARIELGGWRMNHLIFTKHLNFAIRLLMAKWV